MAVFGTLFEKVSVFSDINARVSDYLLADSVKRRICHLCEELAEVVEQWRRLLIKRRKRDVASH